MAAADSGIALTLKTYRGWLDTENNANKWLACNSVCRKPFAAVVWRIPITHWTGETEKTFVGKPKHGHLC